ncbi:MAG: hypothetical protein Q4D65_09075, partial [Peptostreptococcaceae bacterium]|nr:hypothetical protein [Peptostreptococcaceae bacterium]
MVILLGINKNIENKTFELNIALKKADMIESNKRIYIGGAMRKIQSETETENKIQIQTENIS